MTVLDKKARFLIWKQQDLNLQLIKNDLIKSYWVQGSHGKLKKQIYIYKLTLYIHICPIFLYLKCAQIQHFL